MGSSQSNKPDPNQVYERSVNAYNQTTVPSATENEFVPYSQNMTNASLRATARNEQDYGNIMGGYSDFMKNLGGPTKFSFQNVTARRPDELGEGYGYLREAMPGYREFASTGGYSPTDIQELRARGVAPIRAAYGNTMRELDRARALGGNAGAPNYIAAASRAQRDLPGQQADALTTVNANLADAIRQGRMFGLQGITGTGGTMGGLASQEAGRMLQADLANQAADIQTQGMGEQSLQNLRGMQLAGLGGQTSLYGTTPAMASTFGNQALNAYGQRFGAENARNNLGLGYLGVQGGLAAENQNNVPWWQKALGIAGTVAPYAAMAMSSRTVKKEIKEVKDTSKFAKYLKEIPLYTWKYKGDDVKHFGPIAEEFKEKFGVGDGKTLHLVDVMGVVLAAGKEAVANG